MSTDRDTTRIVRSWLEEGATALPDRVLDAVLDQVPATPQRRPPRPAWRLRLMNTPMRLAGAVAAVAVVAALGFVLVSRPGGVAGPAQTPSASVAPSASPPPSPALLPDSGDLAPGTYYMAPSPYNPARVTFTVPAGWANTDGFVHKVPAAGATSRLGDAGYGDEVLFTWVVTHVFSDVCQWEGTKIAAGTTMDELIGALGTQKGRVASATTDVTLGDLPAKRIELTVPADLDETSCDNGIFRFWPDVGGDESGGTCCTAAGSTDVVYVVDVAGKPMVVVARHNQGSSAVNLAELDALVASIVIDASPGTSLLRFSEQGGPLEPGRYLMAGPSSGGPAAGWPQVVIATVPAGWTQTSLARGSGIGNGSTRLNFASVDTLAARPCSAHGSGGRLDRAPVGPTVDDLATALAAMPGVQATAPVDVTLAGFTGKRMELTHPTGVAGCAYLELWLTTPASGESWEAMSTKGSHHTFWILDVDGLRFVVHASNDQDATDGQLAELQTIVESVEIQP